MGTWTGTPRTWVAGEIPTAAMFNSNLRDFGRAFADAWTAYTPTVTASSGEPTTVTATGYYVQVGKYVTTQIYAKSTTKGTAAGYMVATLPVPPIADYAGIGNSYLAQTPSVGLAVVYLSKLYMARYDNATWWANGNEVYATITYQAA